MRLLKYSAALILGLTLYLSLLERQWGTAILVKASGRKQSCPWAKLLTLPWSVARFEELQRKTLKELTAVREDQLGIQLFNSPTRPFWIKKDGTDLDGKHLLAYIIAEQQWLTEYGQGRGVKAGDIVVDVGAHIGTFGDDALRRGAAKVIMVEPDPVNVECIRRNFQQEIADGRVVLIPEGAWSKADTLNFDIGVANSGTGSLVVKESGARRIKVPVRPLDDMLRSAGIDHVDFIKMDIEGAEREALKGAAGVLAKWKPRLMMDSYHLPDDDTVLPAAVAGAYPSYRSICAACSSDRGSTGRIIPYAIFYE